MAVRDELRILLKRWRAVLASLVLALAAVAGILAASTPIYSASEQLFVSTPVSDANFSNAYSGSEFSQQRVKSYAEIASSPSATEPVIRKLGLSLTPTQLAGHISASAPLDTVLLNLSVRDASASEAAAIANALGDQMVILVSQLEKPTSSGVASPLRVTIVKRASVPTNPVSPQKKLYILLAVVVGLAVGIAVARLRDRLDTTIKHGAERAELTSAPTLGLINFDAEMSRNPLVVRSMPGSPAAEGFRQLRTNLRFVSVDERPRCFVITSSEPAEGKSTSAANLAISMAEAGLRVLLVDGDLRRPRLDRYLGLEPAVGLTSILSQGLKPADVIQQWGDVAPLSVLTSGPVPPNPSELLGSTAMADLLALLKSKYAVVIIDSSPLLPVTDAAILSAVTDGAILVVRSGKTRREDVVRSASVLANVDGTLLGTVLNMVPDKGEGSYYHQAYGDTPAERPDDPPRSGRRVRTGTRREKLPLRP